MLLRGTGGVVGLLLALALGGVTATQSPVPDATQCSELGRIIPDVYTVFFQTDAGNPAQVAQDLAREYGFEASEQFFTFPAFPATIPPDRLEAVRSDPRVTAVGPVVEFPPPALVPCSTLSTPPLVTPTATLTPTVATAYPSMSSLPAAPPTAGSGMLTSGAVIVLYGSIRISTGALELGPLYRYPTGTVDPSMPGDGLYRLIGFDGTVLSETSFFVEPAVLVPELAPPIVTDVYPIDHTFPDRADAFWIDTLRSGQLLARLSIPGTLLRTVVTSVPDIGFAGNAAAGRQSLLDSITTLEQQLAARDVGAAHNQLANVIRPALVRSLVETYPRELPIQFTKAESLELVDLFLQRLPQTTPTQAPALPACRPTPTPIPVTVVPDRYAISLRLHVTDTSQGAMELAQQYELTNINGAEPGAPYFIATVPPDRVAALRADSRVFSVDEVVIVPAPFEYAQAPCVTATPSLTPSQTPVSPSASNGEMPSREPVLFVDGILDLSTGALEFKRLFRFSAGLVDPSRPGDGLFRLRGLDMAVLVETSFLVEPVVVYPEFDPPVTTDLYLMLQDLPDRRDAFWIDILRGGQLLRRVSIPGALLRTAVTSIPDSGYTGNAALGRQFLLDSLATLERQLAARNVRAARNQLANVIRPALLRSLAESYPRNLATQFTRAQILELVDLLLQRLPQATPRRTPTPAACSPAASCVPVSLVR